MQLPTFEFEKQLWSNGYSLVAGADEVGRGCFAGPVVAACVIFPNTSTIGQFSHTTITDSKKLKPDQREAGDKWIRENAYAVGVGEVGVERINNDGIVRATYSAFRRALVDLRENTNTRVDFLLTDAFYIPYTRGLPVGNNNAKFAGDMFDSNSRQLAIKKGDTKSISIAAASIIAKVYRDNLMKKLPKNKNYKVYGWGRNKGYGTKEHREAILKHGTTRHHRKQFVETFLNKL